MPEGAVEDVSIRPLSRDDLDAALALSTTAGWNQRADDWLALIGLAPSGSFAAICDGHVVGTSMGIDYGSFSWIAMMLVDPAYRGRGIGRRLLDAALAAVPSARPVRLDATPLGRPLYQSYGFIDETALTRHVAPAGTHRPDAEGEPAPAPRAMSAADLPAIAAADREVFGGERAAVLGWALGSAPSYCQLLGGGKLDGYCLGRHGRLFDQIGPIVAAGDNAARALLATAVRRAAGRALAVDAYDTQRGFTEILRTFGFAPQRPLFRMFRPAAGAEGITARAPGRLVEFAICGPEFA